MKHFEDDNHSWRHKIKLRDIKLKLELSLFILVSNFPNEMLQHIKFEEGILMICLVQYVSNLMNGRINGY
jgi:hypothetical protein